MENSVGKISDSTDGWKYVIVVSKFMIHLLEASISKSFGVLIPEMVIIFDTNLSLLGLICSFPVTGMLIACPVVAHLLKYDKVQPRMVAIIGALICSTTLIASAYTRNIGILGTYLAFNGLGMGMNFMPTLLSLNDYFPRRFVLVSTVTLFGSIIGILFVPLMTERCVRAYGYTGAMLILGGLMMHPLAGGVAIRPPRDLVVYMKASQKEDKECREESKVDKFEQIKKASEANDLIKHIDEVISPATSAEKVDKGFCWSVFQWLRTGIFIKDGIFTLTLPTHFLIQYGAYAWMLFLVPHAEWLGVTSEKAVLLSTIGGIGALIGRLVLFVFLYYDFDAFHICSVASAIAAITFLLDTLVESFPVMCAMAFIQGWAIFNNTAMPVAFCKTTTSPSNFGLACGYSALVKGLGGIAGGLLSGVIFDFTQSFTMVFISIGGVHCLILFNIIIYLVVQRRRKYNEGVEQNE